MVGLTALAYGVVHLALYVVDQNFVLTKVVSEIVLRFYLTIGFVALLGLAVLGATSTDGAMKRMGRNWKRLHRLVYPIAVLCLLHYFIQSKANVSEPVFVAGLFVWRVLPRGWQLYWLTYPVMAVLAGVATAWLEFAWYALATHINPWRVLAASETLRFGLRPAHYVFVSGAAACVLVLGQRALPLVRRLSPLRTG